MIQPLVTNKVIEFSDFDVSGDNTRGLFFSWKTSQPCTSQARYRERGKKNWKLVPVSHDLTCDHKVLLGKDFRITTWVVQPLGEAGDTVYLGAVAHFELRRVVRPTTTAERWARIDQQRCN